MMYKNEAGIERRKAEMSGLVERGAQGSSLGMRVNERQGQPNIWGAKTLDELADYIGLEGAVKETFLAEVERYNMMCYQGRDQDFAKDPRLLTPIDQPPYYATKSVIGYPDAGLVCLNGVITDESQAVLDKSFKPIPGLFATGSTGGGKFFMQYSSLMSGIAIGTAMTLGMLAGRQVASL